MTTWETIISIVVLTALGSCMYDLLHETEWKEMTPERKVKVVLVIVAFAVIWGYVDFIWHIGDLGL